MGIDAGTSRDGPQISKFAMDENRRRLHDALTEAMREHEPDVPCLNTTGPYAPDWAADDPQLQREAARLCRHCPLAVFAACRAYGVSAHLEQGVFGGLTRGQRSKAHTQQVRAEAAAATEQDAAEAAAAAQAETANGQQQRTGTNGTGTVIELNGRNGAQRTKQTARRAANGQYTTASGQRRAANQ